MKLEFCGFERATVSLLLLLLLLLNLGQFFAIVAVCLAVVDVDCWSLLSGDVVASRVTR